MGLDYSITLYFRIEDIERALRATIDFAHIAPELPLTRLTLPDGKQIDLPFTSSFKCDPITLSEGESTHLDTSLLFPYSTEIVEFYGEHPQASLTENGTVYLSLGMIYLWIRCGQKYVEFAYTAATSDMSRLFQNSQNIQTRFLELMKDSGALLGLIDIESNEYLLLENSRISLTGEDSDWRVGHGEHRVDQFTAAMMNSKRLWSERWPDMSAAAAFADRWVAPFAEDVDPMRFLDLPPDDLERILEAFASRSNDVTDDVLRTLFSEPHWGYRCVASCFAAFLRKETFVPVIGDFLLNHWCYFKPYIFALMRIGTPEAADILDQFLTKHLQMSQFDPKHWRLHELDWALAALLRLDYGLRSDRAKKYTGSDGLWKSYADQGLAAVLASNEDYYAAHPEWKSSMVQSWADQISLNDAEQCLETIQQAASRYFD